MVIERQRRRLREAIGELIGRGDCYALVDFPDYANVGDSAIWLGARKLLKEITGRGPSYTCSLGSYRREKLARTSGPIFINGGGNFGDLYPRHQDFRVELLTNFRDRDVIQLPQSVHFDGPATETAAAIRGHGRFTLMVRDQPSFDFAVRSFDCRVVMAPDCAFGLGRLERTIQPFDHFVALLRRDKEGTGIDLSPLLGITEAIVRDWPDEPYRRTLRFDATAKRRLKRGIDALSLGETVITDRLHGHILSVLAGIPDVALDNSTGKVSAYHRQWMPDITSAAVARSADEALDAIAGLTRY